MPSLKVVKASNSAYSRSYIPTAVFVGGTEGVGKAMVEQFGTMTKGRANIVVVGCDAEAGEAVLASLPKQQTTVIHKFIPCDITLMSNVRILTTALSDQLSGLNYLVMTTDPVTSPEHTKRTKTSEGLETQLAVDYYSRWLIINDLLPLLNQTKENGQDAKVVSMTGEGPSPGLDWVKLSKFLDLESGQFNLKDVARAAVYYKDLMIHSFGTLYPTLAFTRAYSGVRWFDEHPKVLQMLPQRFVTANAQRSVQYMWWAFLNGEKGVFRRDEKGRELGWDLRYQIHEKELWNHTMTKLVEYTTTEPMEVTEETLPFPPLPTDIVRLIFELADPKMMRKLNFVSRDVRQWFLPKLFFHVRYRWSYVEPEELKHILTVVKPFVQMITIEYGSQILPAFLKNCPSIVHVTNKRINPNINDYTTFPLRSLSLYLRAQPLFIPGKALYQTLTHLEVLDDASAWTTWDWTWIESLTSLTHLAFTSITQKFRTSRLLLPLAEILRLGQFLRVCVVIETLGSRAFRHSLLARAGLPDLRLVFFRRLHPTSIPLTWETHVRGQHSFWDLTEEAVIRNRAEDAVDPPSALVSRHTNTPVSRSDFDWSVFGDES